ncbi:hypothetical protein BJ165DRAFT_1449908 [Panaeolus papilionaceus]|nr:hypothetical protein BJ165DRAFT_1449908 [Panaeolus papilionaceus]
MSIKAIDSTSVHQITSGQVVVDVQTAIKELVENSIDAGATNIEVRFHQYGLKSIQVIDNGHGIVEEDFETIALKHHTSKLEKFEDLTTMSTFGFRGEALSALCALSEQMTVCTATAATQPKAVLLEMDTQGRVKSKKTAARKQGTTVTITNLFSSLPVRRKEFEKNVKREFGKALALLNAYALVPCSSRSGVILTVTNQPDKGPKAVQIKTLGIPSTRASVVALWGPKATDNLVDMSLKFEVEREKISLKRNQGRSMEPFEVEVQGLLSKFLPGCGRTGTDRQFFFINGRPCNMPKIQKAFNEVYRSFNANQSPFILANFLIPTDCYDVNVSPDKRTILLHREGNVISSLKETLESVFSPSRSTFNVGSSSSSQVPPPKKQSILTQTLRKVAPPPSDHVPEISLPVVDSTPMSGDASKSSTTGKDAEASQPVPMSKDDEEEASITIDSSQTKWGTRLGLVSPTKSKPPSRDVSPEVQIVSNPDPEVEEIEPARKKRKSEIAPVREVAVSYRSETVSKATKKKQTSMAPTTTSSNSRQSLRGRLLGFACSGSQISQSADQDDMEVDDANQESGSISKGTVDEDEDPIEVDELLPSSPVDDCPPSPIRTATTKSLTTDSPALGRDKENDIRAPVETPIEEVEDSEDDDPTSVLSQARSATSTNPVTKTPLRDGIARPEIIRSGGPDGDMVLTFDMARARRSCLRRSEVQRNDPSSTTSTKDVDVEQTLEDAGVSNTDNNLKAADALSRVIEKSDFASMVILGQFNLGFIVIRRQKVDDSSSSGSQAKITMDDLFVVDQHAADEKYNFETLQTTTRIHSQKLFKPQSLELTAGDEMLATEGLDVIRQNGFEIEVDESAPIGRGSRLKLTAQPTSKDTVFNMKDLEEIIHLMRDRPSGQMVRCSKARSMFAMRACRKSVMVGMPLTHQQMTSVVRHMGTMDQPWNCPHGRPTMRHLVDIRAAGSRKRELVDWASFR